MRSVGLRQSFAHRVPVVQRPRTPPFHGDDTGSNPVGDANFFRERTNDGLPAASRRWRSPGEPPISKNGECHNLRRSSDSVHHIRAEHHLKIVIPKAAPQLLA